jgi:putative redox protein
MTIEGQLIRGQAQPLATIATLSDGKHVWAADLALPVGGAESAPDPHALLDSALAACTLLTLELYLKRKDLAVRSLRVSVEHEERSTPEGVHYQLKRRLHIDGDISDEDRAKLLAIAQKCPIHRVLTGEIEVDTELV